ncbi:MAG: ATPase [Bacteroidales bacterium]|nr:ATPase [Bacteroidales bacterium]
MEIPFVYGKMADADNFTDRTADCRRLVENLKSGINTIIISPRRWGKTSLVNKALLQISQDGDYIVCKMDAFNCRSEQQFYETLLNSVLKATTSKIEELMATVKKYIGSLGPKISLGGDPMTEVSVGIDISNQKYSPDEILDLAEKIAIEKGKKIIISIDEFQNVDNFEHAIEIQRKLRSHWQLQQSVCYCLYGSKRHMLMDIFSNYEMPFYKFGDIMMLEKIALADWIPFIIERFRETGKEISEEYAKEIALRVECHPYYVQQYAQTVWIMTEKRAEEATLDTALRQIIDRSALLMSKITDDMRPKQINFLLAIANGEKNLTSSLTLKKYDLGTSANVKNLKKVVIDKDLVDEAAGGKLEIQDPIFKIWLKENYRF